MKVGSGKSSTSRSGTDHIDAAIGRRYHSGSHRIVARPPNSPTVTSQDAVFELHRRRLAVEAHQVGEHAPELGWSALLLARTGIPGWSRPTDARRSWRTENDIVLGAEAMPSSSNSAMSFG
jgi:hypothetical protein